MTDAEFEAQKQRLLALSDKWVDPLGLDSWRIRLAFAREEYEEPEPVPSGSSSVAYCHPDWRYLHATITWNVPKLPPIDDEELEEIFVHECMHILLHEMRTEGVDHEERVASTLARAFLRVRNTTASGEATDGKQETSGLPCRAKTDRC